MAIEVRYYTDPACSWSWGTEPKLRRLIWEFGSQLRFRWVMGGLARSYDGDYRDSEGGIGGGSGCFADLISHWLDVSAETRMPSDPRIWAQNPLSSTYPACMAVKAASEQGEEAGSRFLRRVREGIMVERRKLDHADPLIAVAGEAGLDVERFKVDLRSHAITELFVANLEEVRSVPEEARGQGGVRSTEGKERVTFPSAVFVSDEGQRHAVWGWQPYDAYRMAALGAGASPAGDDPLQPLQVIERFRRAATREVEVLTGLPGPVVRAELWAAAREWRLKPVSALTGELWEQP